MAMEGHAPRFALNHMCVPSLSSESLIDLAAELNCVGVEFRNDFPDRTLFDGAAADEIGARSKSAGIAILAVAEVKGFNAWSDRVREQAEALMRQAAGCGAGAVSLIPTNDGSGCGNGERQANLRIALRALKPMLEEYELTGFIEPLGFETCSLRYKEEAVDTIEALNAKACFRLIHDTFHHFLAGEGMIFPAETGIIHVSGVADRIIGVSDMRDEHRVLVDESDRLDNISQIAALRAAGCDAPLSFEPFAPEVHALANPREAVGRSIDFITSRLSRAAA